MSEVEKNSVTTPALLKMTDAFVGWLQTHGFESYDPYDIWGTRYGLWSRKVYYEKGAVGVPLIVPILLAEMLCPGIRRFFVQKLHYPTADGQLTLAFLNLYRITGDEKYLGFAVELGDALLKSSIPGWSGHCWGYPFDWQCNKGLWKKNTPYITATPYAFEAFLGLHDATSEPKYLDVADSAARFVSSDLKDISTSANASASSYSPLDNTKVVNATAYRAWMLFEAARRFQSDQYEEKARRNLNFVLETQREDGAWMYSIDNPKEQFIDHFHTCFVLKNLHKMNRTLQEPRTSEAIARGYAYYRKELFDENDMPKSFSVKPRTQILKLEMYNMAEAITLGALLHEEIPAAFALAHKMARKLGEEYQLPAGHFVTRVYLGGFQHKLPFLRWPQAQLFYSLTNLLVSMDAREGSPNKSKTEVDLACQ
jgi:hypothetical protein